MVSHQSFLFLMCLSWVSLRSYRFLMSLLWVSCGSCMGLWKCLRMSLSVNLEIVKRQSRTRSSPGPFVFKLKIRGSVCTPWNLPWCVHDLLWILCQPTTPWQLLTGLKIVSTVCTPCCVSHSMRILFPATNPWQLLTGFIYSVSNT